MNKKIYAVIIILYVVVIGQLFRNKMFTQQFNLYTFLYVFGLFVLAFIAVKYLNLTNKKSWLLYMGIYGVSCIVLALYFIFKN